MRFFLPIPFILACALFSGCGQTIPPAAQIAREIKVAFDADQLKIGGEASRELYLIEIAPNRYEGYVEWTSGARSGLTVARQSNGETVWRIIP